MAFGIVDTKYRYRAYCREGQWQKGAISEDPHITIHESSNVLHYGQCCFEGLKAHRTKEGEVLLFRHEKNWERLNTSLEKLVIPPLPYELFKEGVFETVRANIDAVPPYNKGESLYIRPFVIGIGPNLGVNPGKEYLFGVFVSPVGAYFAGGLQTVDFVTTEYDRAAPMGTGRVKVGGNYAASLYPRSLAINEGYQEVVYLDPATHTKIEEIGAANFFGITSDRTFVTPDSSSILPSITRFSLIDVAKDHLKMEIEQRDCYIDRLDEFVEAGACGTAAVISPIGSITHKGYRHVFNQGKVGEVVRSLYGILTGIQQGDIEAPQGWVEKVL